MSPFACTATALTLSRIHRCDQSRVPPGEYFCTPNIIDITTFPQGSTTTAAPAPVSFDHTCAPAGDSFTRKPARAEAVNGPPPKSIVPEKSPVTTTLPAGSVATPIPLSYPDPPPVTLDQRC